jgi:arylsulfatase A-like enzyme
MSSRNAAIRKAEVAGSSTEAATQVWPGRLSFLLICAWCGVVAGLLEVGVIVVRKRAFDPDQLYKMSRHFVWLVPLSNLGVFLALAVIGGGIVVVWPGRGRIVFARILGALVLLPSLLVAFPRIYSLAWLVVALGVAARVVPLIGRNGLGFRRFVRITFPVAITIVAILGAAIGIDDRNRQRRENARALPPAGSPNVLLIVMDTVGAGHLSLNGYIRATSHSLVELAERGTLFSSARAPSSWTLPSHASMFTGRWLHELSVGWFTPLDGEYPTLAEFLGARGYATAGFVANTYYCARDSGLARGFTRYQDFIFPGLTALKTGVMVSRALDGFHAIVYFSEDLLDAAGLFPYVERFWQSVEMDRKGAASVNRELLGWLSERVQPERPFFAFLNYYDAHYPYQLPPGRPHRFGAEPTDDYQRVLIHQWRDIEKETLSPEGLAFAADSYDDCVADLDEQLGVLYDELDRRGALDKTWLIITADHGESFGEHPGVFGHGSSLYETEVHVPLLIVPPKASARKQVVNHPVSLRDLAATIVDLVGQNDGSPFPGESLARFWAKPERARPVPPPSALFSFAEVVPNDPRDRDYWGVPRPLSPLGTVKQAEWSYIRRQDDGREELFHLSDDPKEQRNLAADPAVRASLERMRAVLDGASGGPLSPRRFGR